MFRFISIVGKGNHYTACRKFLDKNLVCEKGVWYSQNNSSIFTDRIIPITQLGLVFFNLPMSTSEDHVRTLKKCKIPFIRIWPDTVLMSTATLFPVARPQNVYLGISDEVDWNRVFADLKIMGFSR